DYSCMIWHNNAYWVI
nr:immunoglobulin light chain junction region [Macaca mulatta]